MRFANLFSDHAVLQREKPIPVWGWARPGDRVEVVLGDTIARTAADPEGRFLVRLPARPAGGPYTLSATAWPLRKGNAREEAETVAARDVWVGEVWLASGQSNMEMAVEATGVEVESLALSPRVRMFTVPRVAALGRATDVDAAWQTADAETVMKFSATAYHFAARLERELGLAVGVLHSSWGGTIVEAWTSRETLARNPDLQTELQRYDADLADPAYWAKIDENQRDDERLTGGAFYFAQFCERDPGNQGEGRGWAAPDHDDAAWETIRLPGCWTVLLRDKSGVFWFRREVALPAGAAGRDLELHLGAVDKQDVTYWNGERVGATGSGFDDTKWNLPRRYPVPGRLVRAGRNVVAVRAYSFAYGGGLIGPKMSARPGAGPAVDLAGTWRVRAEFEVDKPMLGVEGPGAGPGNANSPHILFDRMIHPLIPYALRGAIWYQGESNADRWRYYQRQMADLARDWAGHWGQGPFPLIQVQLAGYMAPKDYDEAATWPRLREAQLRATADESALGMVSALDIGEAGDIHPHNKLEVGERLAGWALARTYGRSDVVAHGPHFAGFGIEGNRIRVRFTGTEGGLKRRADSGDALRTFHVAGTDRKFRPARAEIEGDTVVVWEPGLERPVAVRYAWAQNPEAANLVNGAGLPASSFRTDAW